MERLSSRVAITPATREQHRTALAARAVGPLPAAPDGPIVPAFNALTLAQAIDQEVGRAQGCGHDKIRIDMAIHDAADMAAFLRRSALRSE